MVNIGQHDEALFKAQNEAVGQQTKGKSKIDVWVYICTLMFLANLSSYLVMVVLLKGNLDCPDDVSLLVWLTVGLMFSGVMFLNEACACSPPDGALRCSENLAKICRFVAVFWGVIGFFEFCFNLPLPSGMCGAYMWILVPTWSSAFIISVMIGSALATFGYKLVPTFKQLPLQDV